MWTTGYFTPRALYQLVATELLPLMMTEFSVEQGGLRGCKSICNNCKLPAIAWMPLYKPETHLKEKGNFINFDE